MLLNTQKSNPICVFESWCGLLIFAKLNFLTLVLIFIFIKMTSSLLSPSLLLSHHYVFVKNMKNIFILKYENLQANFTKYNMDTELTLSMLPATKMYLGHSIRNHSIFVIYRNINYCSQVSNMYM